MHFKITTTSLLLSTLVLSACIPSGLAITAQGNTSAARVHKSSTGARPTDVEKPWDEAGSKPHKDGKGKRSDVITGDEDEEDLEAQDGSDSFEDVWVAQDSVNTAAVEDETDKVKRGFMDGVGKILSGISGAFKKKTDKAKAAGWKRSDDAADQEEGSLELEDDVNEEEDVADHTFDARAPVWTAAPSAKSAYDSAAAASRIEQMIKTFKPTAATTKGHLYVGVNKQGDDYDGPVATAMPIGDVYEEQGENDGSDIDDATGEIGEDDDLQLSKRGSGKTRESDYATCEDPRFQWPYNVQMGSIRVTICCPTVYTYQKFINNKVICRNLNSKEEGKPIPVVDAAPPTSCKKGKSWADPEHHNYCRWGKKEKRSQTLQTRGDWADCPTEAPFVKHTTLTKGIYVSCCPEKGQWLKIGPNNKLYCHAPDGNPSSNNMVESTPPAGCKGGTNKDPKYFNYCSKGGSYYNPSPPS